MILGNNYVIYEYQDIFTAADAMNEANEALLQLRKQNRGTCQTTYC